MNFSFCSIKQLKYFCNYFSKRKAAAVSSLPPVASNARIHTSLLNPSDIKFLILSSDIIEYPDL